jgi:hypothetical protein
MYHRGQSHAALYSIYPTHGLHQELESKILKLGLVVLQRKAWVSCKKYGGCSAHLIPARNFPSAQLLTLKKFDAMASIPSKYIKLTK